MKKTLGRDSGENLDSEVEEHFSAADAYLGEVSSTISLLSPPSMDELVRDIMKQSRYVPVRLDQFVFAIVLPIFVLFDVVLLHISVLFNAI